MYNIIMEEERDVKPWDLLNPKKERSEQELADYRMSICRTCEHFLQRSQRCSQCGCFMSLKTTLKQARCPVRKW
jgi:hypothetical protein